VRDWSPGSGVESPTHSYLSLKDVRRGLTTRSYVWPYCRLAWRLQPNLEWRRNGVMLNTMTEDTSVAAHYDNTILRAGREIVARPP
jgi:hypothetical protein